MTPTPEDDPLLVGYAAIAAALTEAFACSEDPISEDAAYRLATRQRRPLPVDGYERRVQIRQSVLAQWVAVERRRRGRVSDEEARRRLDEERGQLDLFGAAACAVDAGRG